MKTQITLRPCLPHQLGHLFGQLAQGAAKNGTQHGWSHAGSVRSSRKSAQGQHIDLRFGLQSVAECQGLAILQQKALQLVNYKKLLPI